MSGSGPAVRKQEEDRNVRPLSLCGFGRPAPVLNAPVAAGAQRVPALRVMPLRPSGVRSFARVPTHAVGVFHEKREYPRATLRLPLRLRGVNGRAEDFPITLVTRDISSSGVFFLCPRKIGVETPIELEVVLVSRPLGRGNVVIVSQARVARVEPAATPGWFGIGASFEDLEFDRDDSVATNYFAF